MIACPGCSAGLRFDIASQAMHCDHCGESYDPYDFDSKEKDAEVTQSFDALIYSCSSCGAELLTTDESDITSFCPYCGNASILFDRLKKIESPAHIIPFKLTKEDCKKAYLRQARKAIFTPKRYKSPEQIDSFRGIYMPYWSYEADYDGAFAVDYETPTTRDGDYLVSERFRISGTITKRCEGYAHDASESFSDEISECLSPFDETARKPFTPGFLSGFYADAADMSAKAYRARAREHSDGELREEVLATPAVSAEVSARSKPEVSLLPTPKIRASMAMYPVWFMSYREGDRITYAAVNGQTGKVAADFPVSTGRYLVASLILAAVFFAAFNFLFTLRPDWALGATTLLLLIGLWIGRSPLGRDERAADFRLPALVRVLVWLMIAAAVVILFVTKPVYNMWYYVPALIEAVILFLIIYQSFRYQMERATRRPPQFNKKGGDDDA